MNDEEMTKAVTLAEDWLEDLHPQFQNDDASVLARALLASRAEVARMRSVFDGIRRDFDTAIAAHDPSDPRHRSHGGQHTNGPCCAFGNLNPSAVRPLREWRDAIDDALDAARSEGEG